MPNVDPITKTCSYAASACGAPAMARPNSKFVFGAEVQKAPLRKSGLGVEVHGVQVIVGDHTQTITAPKEVILAARVFQSPKLLRLSRIGGHEVLQKLGIEFLIDNPNVGENL